VPPLRDFLSRFRPAGAPGAARAAVPADRRRLLEAELDPVLTLLDDVDDECAAVVRQARQDAGQIIAAARARATALEERTRRRAAAAHRRTAAEVLAAARAEAADTMSGAARQAEATRELARQRLPGLAQRAVALVRDLRDDGPGPPARRLGPPRPHGSGP
jgi:vacuolar-type H+-ATPase subunit H